jgi:hypothetical protein
MTMIGDDWTLGLYSCDLAFTRNGIMIVLASTPAIRLPRQLVILQINPILPTTCITRLSKPRRPSRRTQTLLWDGFGYG